MNRNYCVLFTILFMICTVFVVMSCSSPTKPTRVAAPVFSPPTGNYSQAQQISISCATDGSEIRYTLDGSTPPTNSVVYNGPFMVELGTTVKAIATKNGLEDSPVVQALYSDIVPTPTFGSHLSNFIFNPDFYVSIIIDGHNNPNDWPQGLYVRYTLNGSDPDSTSTLYEGRFNLAESCTLKARAFWWYNWNYGPVASVYCTVLNQMNIVGTCTCPGLANYVDVSGNYAYVTCSNVGLHIFDISNPSTVFLTGTCSLPHTLRRVVVLGNYAYVAYFYGLKIVDISNPYSPHIVGTCETPIIPRDLSVSGSYAYLVGSNNVGQNTSLQIINVSDTSAPYITGTLSIPNQAYSIKTADDHAYVIQSDLNTYNSSLRIINISNPALPQLAGYYNIQGTSGNVALSGHYAYVESQNYVINIINISDPSNPFLSGYGDLYGDTFDIDINGNDLYCSDSSYGLKKFNIAGSTSPDIISSCSLADVNYDARGLRIVGNYAYALYSVSSQYSGLVIIETE